MWKDIKKEKPTEEGVYVVATFEGDVMTDLHLDYALYEGNFTPNRYGSYGIHVTHWMKWSDFREAISKIERQ